MRSLEPSLDDPDEVVVVAEVATIRMLDGPRAGRVFVLERRDTMIGAAEASTIRIRDEGIAARHALVHSASGRLPVLVDLTGDGRTRINGKVVADAPLRDGDILILGPQVVARFEYRGVVRMPHSRPLPGVRVAPSLFATLGRQARVVASLFALGATEADIADAADLERDTVAECLEALRGRFGVRRRAQLIACLIDPPRQTGA